jgi:hypothetical protein
MVALPALVGAFAMEISGTVCVHEQDNQPATTRPYMADTKRADDDLERELVELLSQSYPLPQPALDIETGTAVETLQFPLQGLTAAQLLQYVRDPLGAINQRK